MQSFPGPFPPTQPPDSVTYPKDMIGRVFRMESNNTHDGSMYGMLTKLGFLLMGIFVDPYIEKNIRILWDISYSELKHFLKILIVAGLTYEKLSIDLTRYPRALHSQKQNLLWVS